MGPVRGLLTRPLGGGRSGLVFDSVLLSYVLLIYTAYTDHEHSFSFLLWPFLACTGVSRQ